MKNKLLVTLAAVALSGCVTPMQKSQPEKLPDDPRECAKNFNFNGSFWSGRTFKTHALVKGVSKATGMQRASRFLATEGWNITSTDKDLGIISAAQTISYGQGKTAPLNVSLEPVNGALKVSVTFALSGGTTSPVDAVRNHFCSVISSVEGR